MRLAPRSRPLEQDAVRLLTIGALLILGCAALGGWAFASAAIYLTTPKES